MLSWRLISLFNLLELQDITKPLVDEVCKTLKRWRYSFSALKSLQEILYCEKSLHVSFFRFFFFLKHHQNRLLLLQSKVVLIVIYFSTSIYLSVST